MSGKTSSSPRRGRSKSRGGNESSGIGMAGSKSKSRSRSRSPIAPIGVTKSVDDIQKEKLEQAFMRMLLKDSEDDDQKPIKNSGLLRRHLMGFGSI